MDYEKLSGDRMEESGEARYRSLLEQLPAIVYTDEANTTHPRTVFVSSRIRDILGCSPEEWLAGGYEMWIRSIHPDDMDRVTQHYHDSIEHSSSYTQEYRMFRRDGSMIWVRDSAAIQRDEYGKALNMQGVLYDITESRNAENTLRLQSAALEAAIFETPAVGGKPRMRIIRLRDVTSDILNRRNTRSFGEAITHKIRTPVTHIVSSLDLLSRLAPQMSAAEIAQFSETALHGAKRLNETLDRILKYSNIRIEPGAMQGFPLSELKPLVEKVSADIGLSPVTVTVADDVARSRLSLPAQSLEVVLWEVLGNSKKFHPAGKPNLMVEAFRTRHGQVTLSICDDGVSLSPRQLTIAMLPYYQGEKDFTGEAPGMGLGLSTVNAIVWGAGGACRITNRSRR